MEAVQQKALGEEHPDILTSLNNLASLLQAQGKLEEAELLFRKELEGEQKALGEEHPYTLNTKGNLGLLMMKANDPHTDGRSMVTEVLHLLEEKHNLTEAHPWIKKFKKGLL